MTRSKQLELTPHDLKLFVINNPFSASKKA